MTLWQFLSILRARWLLACSVLATIVTATAVVNLLLPKSYTASASVVIDSRPDPVSALLSPGMGSPTFMATQVDILQSERVAQRVVRNLKLAENPNIREQWLNDTQGQGNIEAWLANTFSRNMDVKPSRESNVITVSYKAPDPRFAAALANAFVGAFVDISLEMRVNPAKQYLAFFDERLKGARDVLEQAQAKLSAFQRANGLIATDERLDVENARLNELSSQYVALSAVTAESTSRQVQADSRSRDRLQDVLANPLVAGMKSDIARAESGLQTLVSRLGDKHPQVIEARASIAEMQKRLEDEARTVSGSVGVSNVINLARTAQVRSDLDAQRAKVLRLKAVRDEAQVLARDVDNAQRAYDAVQSRLTQTSLESQNNQTNLFPLTEATPPTEPSTPRVRMNLLLAVFLGTLVSVGAVLGIELADRRVRTAADIVESLGLPLMGVLTDGKRRARGANRTGLLTGPSRRPSVAATKGA